jgi:DNA-binding MarR family transcriptional regulator
MRLAFAKDRRYDRQESSLSIKQSECQAMKRSGIIKAIGEAVRLNQEATDAFDDAACGVLGINRTDLKCLSIIARRGPVAVGEIGKEADLTRGAMTTALDRIESSGYARRLRHPDDRRGVLVELTAKANQAIDAIWGQYVRDAEAFFKSYSAGELKTILRYLQEGRSAQEANTARVKKLRKTVS